MRALRRRTLRSAAATLPLFLGAALPPSPAAALEPYKMVRSLQLVQDRVADGDHAALPMQRKLLEMIDGRLRRAAPADFEDRRNFRALLVYSMSGGNPATIREILPRLSLEPEQMRLGGGVTDYVSGRVGAALAVFEGVDPVTQEPELGAFLALVKASLMVTESPGKALAMFDKARLLGPGSLVEEAALRRIIMLSAQQGDTGRFTRAAIQYVTRFLRSPYATQFAEAYVAGVVALHETIDLASVDETVSYMNDEQAKVIYLRIARKAAVEGYPELLAFAAAKARKWADPQAGERDPRALLYANLAAVTSDNVAEVLSVLKTIDRARLSADDRELLDAAAAVAAGVTALPEGLVREAAIPPEPAAEAAIAAEGAEPDGAVDAPRSTEAPGDERIDGLVTSAREKLEAIDALLKETSE